MQKAADLNVPGKSFPMLFETFPLLARLPPAWFPSLFQGLGKRRRGRQFFYALAEEAHQKDPDQQCYANQLFDEAPKYRLRNDEIASLAGNLFGAGSDTSSSTLITFVLACCAFPETLPKAWEELDRIVGHHRSPTWEDEAELVYTKAFVKEVFRWRSVAIIGGQVCMQLDESLFQVQGPVVATTCSPYVSDSSRGFKIHTDGSVVLSTAP